MSPADHISAALPAFSSAIEAVEGIADLAGAPKHAALVLRHLRDAHAQAYANQSALRGEFPDDYAASIALSAMSAPGADRVIVGSEPYEALDPGWIGAFYQYLFATHVPLPTGLPPTIQIADDVALGILGDWGSGGAAALAVGNAIADMKLDHTIHLGDVYYSGTPDEQRANFLAHWPAGIHPTAPSFALNSNHEMYSGGAGYFNTLLADPRFAAQQGHSAFALENAYWLVIALDTAYEARDFLYKQGVLNAAQLGWAVARVGQARSAKKHVIVLTHHHGLELADETMQTATRTEVWRPIVDALRPDFWYFGHNHAGVIYEPEENVYARCIGHGAVPYLPFPRASTPIVSFAETETAGDTQEPRRALNGALVVTLAGPSITEELIDERGECCWIE